MSKLDERQMHFLWSISEGRPLRLASREEDRARQSVRRLGLAEVVMNPRRWVITPAGRAALKQESDKR